jgi:hypothetical protein
MIEKEMSQRGKPWETRLVEIPGFAEISEGSKSSPPMRAAAKWFVSSLKPPKEGSLQKTARATVLSASFP